MGGPVILPKLYNGRTRHFSSEASKCFGLPKSQTFVNSVPTEAMRNGDLSAYLNPAWRRRRPVDRLPEQPDS
jgi:hypothetical protein